MNKFTIPPGLVMAQYDMQLLVKIAQPFLEIEQASEVRVFGSVARWLTSPITQTRPTARSDIDLILVVPSADCVKYSSSVRRRKPFSAGRMEQQQYSFRDLYGNQGENLRKKALDLAIGRFSHIDLLLYPPESFTQSVPKGERGLDKWEREVVHQSVRIL